MKNLLIILVFCSTATFLAQDCIIPNGSFEDWTGNDVPHYWYSTNVAGNEGNANELADFEFRNVFRTPGKFGSGVELRNVSIEDLLKQKMGADWEKIPLAYREQIRTKSSFSSSIGYCVQKDCNKLLSRGMSDFKPLLLPISEEQAPAYLKGYYKADLKGGDKLWVNVAFLDAGYNVVGGVKPGRTENVIAKNTMDWVEFKIPFDYFPKKLKHIKYAYLQFNMMGKDFPSSYPFGIDATSLAMKYPSQEYSKVYLDELCFGGQGKEVSPDDPSLVGTTTGEGSGIGSNDDTNNNDENEQRIYIATNGSDANSGTRQAPFATIQKAITVAQGKRLQGKRVTIVVGDGMYRQEASINGTGGSGLPPLRIEAENKHQAIFIGSEPITENPNWQNQVESLYMSTTANLHPDQKPIFNPNNYSNPMETMVPALVVNGTQLKHQQGGDLRNTANAYMYTPQQFFVNPGSSNLSNAAIEVSVRENAIAFTNGGNVTVHGLRLKGYPQASIPQLTAQQLPGLEGVQAEECLFE